MRLAAVFAVLAACSYATPVRGPDGQANWFDVYCRHDKSGCYQMAAEKCPLGYDVADQSEQHGAVAFSNTNGNVNATTYGSTTTGTYHGTTMGVVAPTFKGEMLIKCKSHAAPPPPRPPVPPMCETAFSNVRRLADTFVALHPGRQPVADLPTEEEFYKACSPMSDAAHVCIWQESEGKMGRDCDTQVWPTRDWLIIERLFLIPQ
jgi:hypothetical protein